MFIIGKRIKTIGRFKDCRVVFRSIWTVISISFYKSPFPFSMTIQGLVETPIVFSKVPHLTFGLIELTPICNIVIYRNLA